MRTTRANLRCWTLFAELRDQRTAAAGGRRARAAPARRRQAARRSRAKAARRARGARRKARARRGARRAARPQGEQIFATLHELEAAEREAAKERAGRAVRGVQEARQERAAHRRSARATSSASLESDRDAALGGRARRRRGPRPTVESAVVELCSRRRRYAAARRQRRDAGERRSSSAPAGGSRIVVGRSPAENADLTFRLARPERSLVSRARHPRRARHPFARGSRGGVRCGHPGRGRTRRVSFEARKASAAVAGRLHAAQARAQAARRAAGPRVVHARQDDRRGAETAAA